VNGIGFPEEESYLDTSYLGVSSTINANHQPYLIGNGFASTYYVIGDPKERVDSPSNSKFRVYCYSLEASSPFQGAMGSFKMAFRPSLYVGN
jgi:hypothetical protein